MSYNPKIPKDYRAMVRAAMDQGWTFSISGKGHAKLTSPDGQYSTPIPGTSGAAPLRKAIRIRLVRHGFVDR